MKKRPILFNTTVLLVFFFGMYRSFHWGVDHTKKMIRETVNQAIQDNRKELQIEMKQSVKEGMTEAMEEQLDRLPPWLRAQVKDK